MAQSPDVIDTDEIAEREARREKHAHLSPWVVASRIVAHYRARYVPAIFALLILVPGAMTFVSGRDLASMMQNQFDAVAPSPLPTLIGRVGTLLILALSALAIFAWFSSERRGQGRRRSASRSRQRGLRSRSRPDSGSRRRKLTAEEREAVIRSRMMSTSHAGRRGLPPGASATAMESRAVGLPGSVSTGDSGGTSTGSPFVDQGPLSQTAGSDRSRQRSRSRRATRLTATVGIPITALVVAMLAYQFGYAVLPQFTGLSERFNATALYFPFVALALFASRRMPRREALDAIQWSIALYMIAGLVLAYTNPAAALTSAGLEQRVSFVDTRFWGVGSNPNSVAPLAILQLILQLRQRWPSNIFWLAANLVCAGAAVIVLIWAQSQTAWAAAALILPWVLVRSRLASRVDLTAIQPHHAVIGLLAIVISVAILGIELIARDTAGALSDALPGAQFWKGGVLTTATRVGDQLMTGRGVIWSLALDVWRDHPLFGFGSTAWDYDFRDAYGLPLATSAHNQLMQVLSVSGLFGLIPFLAYFGLLGYFAWKASGPSRGLTMALFILIAVRTITEVPLETQLLMSSDVAMHLALLYCVFVYTPPSGERQRLAA